MSDEERCDQPWDECDDVLAERNRLRAEVAALRETLRVRGEVQRYYREKLAEARALREADIAALSFGRNAALKREAEARALLADWLDESRPVNIAALTRAFLRRDEARRFDPGPHPSGIGDYKVTMTRDGARRCTCGHWEQHPECAADMPGARHGCFHDEKCPARDEAPRCTCGGSFAGNENGQPVYAHSPQCDLARAALAPRDEARR